MNEKYYDPDGVLKFFEKLCSIPHGSGNEKLISDYLIEFAKERGLWVVQDSALNVIIKKNASQGYESSESVILQGHMDMVCEKAPGAAHNFLTDGLRLVTDGDFIKAEGTTLGADNCIAVAMILALLDSSNIPHPKIEALITTNEETGMDGAKAVDSSLFDSKLLINLDNEDDQIFFASCAGGVRYDLSLPIEYILTKSGKSAYTINIAGLKGGHSGMAIHLQRCNAIRLMASILSDIESEFNINLSVIEGGSKENAIPREAMCSFVIDKELEDSFNKRFEELCGIYLAQHEAADPGLTIAAKRAELPEAVFSTECTKKIIAAGILIPNGVHTMSAHIKDLVESSSNIGVLQTVGQNVVYSSSLRSSVLSLKRFLAKQIEQVACLTGAETQARGDYPAWEYNPKSPLRELFLQTYSDLFSKDAKVSAIHAGLECGVFTDKFPNIDMISIGPNMYDVHTPDERLSISSTLRVWNLLKAVLSAMKPAKQ